MILNIVTYPDERLKAKAEPVEKIDDEIRRLSGDMLDTMYVANGVGLAAPQIGRSLRLVVIDIDHHKTEKNPLVLINPELEFLGDEIVSEQEGCLSVPMGYRADVPRNSRILVKYQDLNGEWQTKVADDFLAIAIQHEVDHLDGKLFIDRISRLKRGLYDSSLKKWARQKDTA